jgi:hypothetical protein
MIAVRFCLALVLLWPLRPAWALDPAAADILTLRLGMTDAEVITRLDTQGARIARDGGTIRARTKDGDLRVAFDDGGRVSRIVYAFTGHGLNEAAAVREAVIERFGTPVAEAPLAWCRRPARDGACPADAPRLVFEQGAGQGPIGLLTLTAAEPR